MNALKEVATSAASAASSVTNSAATAVGLAPQPQQGDLNIVQEMEAQCKMSKTNRMIGFGVTFGLGFLLSVISFWSIMKPVSFALLFSIGNIISILSTGFLIGFVRQLKNMFDSKRLISTVIFLSALILTLVCALAIPDKMSGVRIFLCIVFIVIQYCALVWYTASYIPFAQQMLSNMASTLCRRATG